VSINKYFNSFLLLTPVSVVDIMTLKIHIAVSITHSDTENIEYKQYNLLRG